MRRLLAGVVALLLAATYLTSAFAQSGVSVQQSGTITPGQVPYWVTSGVIAGDASSADSPVTSFGVTSSNAAGICANSARQSSGAWNALCLGFISGVPTVSVQNYGTAPVQGLQFDINGAVQGFPSVSPLPVTLNGLPCFLTTAGALTQCTTINQSVDITINPYTPPVAFPGTQALGVQIPSTGTCTTGNNNCYYNFINIPSDNVVVGSGTSGTWVSGIGLEENWHFGGAAMTGQRIGIGVNVNLDSTTGNTAAVASYGAAAFNMNANANDNGTSTSSANSRGQIEAVNIISRLNNGATNYRALQGAEIDVQAATGSSTYEKVGLQVVQLSTDAVQGATYDTAIGIANQSGAVGWTNGILFGGLQGAWPFVSTATAITCASPCGTLASFIDMSGATITTNFLNSKGFSVNGSGQITTGSAGGALGSLTLNGSTSGSSVITTGTAGQLVLSNNQGGQQTTFNDGGNGTAFIVGTAGGTIANRIGVTPATTTNAPVVTVTGTDTSIDLNLTPKGTGKVTIAGGTAPTLTAGCNGTGQVISSNANDNHGTITGQNSASTSCTLTFSAAYTAAPDCTVTGLSSPLTGAVTVGTGTIVVNFTSTANYKWSYICLGN
jgi:hypothetical protein